MSVEIKNGEYLASYGKALIENGYKIIPIPQGSKSPGYQGWQKLNSTKSLLDDWLNHGYANAGIGILTRETPCIDLDITDESVLKEILDYVELEFGTLPVRVGRAPRCLLMFRTNEPFRKMKTGKFQDEWEDLHEAELLADGQQFLAYAIHPTTNKPYTWTSEINPLNTHAHDLPELTAEQCRKLMEYIVSVFEKNGFIRKSNALSGKAFSPDEVDDFADITQVVNLPTEEIRRRLMTLPNNDDHDFWVKVGMALYHQYGGDEEGLALWHEWSESALNYEEEALNKRWKSFQIDGKGRSPITAASLIKWSNEAMASKVVEQVTDIRTKFFDAKVITEWHEVCAIVRKAEIPNLERAEIAEIARKRYQEITSTRLPITEIRKALAYQLPDNENAPKWVSDWVFDAMTDCFFHLPTKITMTVRGYDMVNARHALTKKDIIEGKTEPTSKPSDLAMNVYKIPEVYGSMYYPSEDQIFWYNGIRLANTYPDYQIPEVPTELASRDKRAIKIVKEHIKHLLEDEVEQRLLLDWLAWIVQNPGKRVNWALLLQGVEGDGKSFFGFLLRAVMGQSNVRMLNANVLEGSFTGWAHGQCVTVIEEPRLHGQNKYDVLNKIKPLITNSVIEIHPKGRDPYNTENTVNYFLPTNYRDALPLNTNDRRYCVLFSAWQERSKLIEFTQENPDYYLNLYKTLEEAAPGLRKWLVEHEVSDTFPAGGDAPMTKSHAYMVEAALPPLMQALNEIIREGNHHDITEDIVNATALPDILIGMDVEIENTSGLARMMENNGYTFLGRFRVGLAGGGQVRLWSKNPRQFYTANRPCQHKIKTYLKKRSDDML